jgi:hypothetical protein
MARFVQRRSLCSGRKLRRRTRDGRGSLPADVPRVLEHLQRVIELNYAGNAGIKCSLMVF